MTLVSVGPVTTASPSASKKPWPSLFGEASRGRMPFAQARASVSGVDDRAGDLFLSVDAVGVAGEREDARPAVERDRERQQELDVAPAAAVAAHRHRRLAARQQHARRRDRLRRAAPPAARCPPSPCRRRAPRPRGCRPGSPACSPRRARRSRPLRATLRRGDHPRRRRARGADRRASPSRRRPIPGCASPRPARRCRSGGSRPARRRRWSDRRPSDRRRSSIGSSPGTSEISSVTTCAGWHAAARRPPLIADRCRRTQFISPIVAPDLSSARLTSCLSSSVRPSAGKREQRRAAAGDQRNHEVVGGEAADQSRACAPRRRRPAASGTGCAASTISMRSHGTA